MQIAVNRNNPFCAPAELLTQGLMSKAVDVYAYGVLLWELYVGDRWVQRSWRRTQPQFAQARWQQACASMPAQTGAQLDFAALLPAQIGRQP